MKSPEMGDIAPENDNAKFINQFSSFGIDDQEIIDKLLRYGKIVNIDVFDDSLEIFYKTGEYEKVVVRKSEVKKIDPQSKQVLETQKHFAIDLKPEKSFADQYATKRNYKKYPDYKRKHTEDLVDMTRQANKGRIIE